MHVEQLGSKVICGYAAGLHQPRDAQAAVCRAAVWRAQRERRECWRTVAGCCCSRCRAGTAASVAGRPAEQTQAGSRGLRARAAWRRATTSQRTRQPQLAWFPPGVLILFNTAPEVYVERTRAMYRNVMETYLACRAGWGASIACVFRPAGRQGEALAPAHMLVV